MPVAPTKAAKLGVLAGSGALPREVIAAAAKEGREVVLVGFDGFTDEETFALVPGALRTRLGQAANMEPFFRDHQVTDVVMAGKIRRPTLREVRPNWRTARFVAQLGLSALGDDGVLRRFIRLVEAKGFHVLSVPEVLHGATLPPGALGQHQADALALADIERGLTVLRHLAPADVGQAVVVQQGLVLGVEAIEGTDALIARCGLLQRKGPRAILVKARKDTQDPRADLPVVGLQTMKAIIAAGLRGVAVDVGGTLVIEQESLRREADRAGVFVVAVPR